MPSLLLPWPKCTAGEPKNFPTAVCDVPEWSIKVLWITLRILSPTLDPPHSRTAPLTMKPTCKENWRKESSVPLEQPCPLQSWQPAWQTETHDTLHWKSPASGLSVRPAHAGTWQYDPHHHLWLAESEKQRCWRYGGLWQEESCSDSNIRTAIFSVTCKQCYDVHNAIQNWIFDVMNNRVKHMFNNIQSPFACQINSFGLLTHSSAIYKISFDFWNANRNITGEKAQLWTASSFTDGAHLFWKTRLAQVDDGSHDQHCFRNKPLEQSRTNIFYNNGIIMAQFLWGKGKLCVP